MNHEENDGEVAGYDVNLNPRLGCGFHTPLRGVAPLGRLTPRHGKALSMGHSDSQLGLIRLTSVLD